MPGPQSSVRMRTGGGFNQGMGQFGEHFDESVTNQAMQQKALGQQQAAPSGAAAAAAASQTKPQSPQQRPPREVGSFKDELLIRPARDVSQGVKEFFSLNTWLGINPDTKDPQEKQRMVATHRRYQQLTEEQQAYARKKYEADMKKKQLEEEEKQRRKQQEEEQKNQELPLPSSPKKGPIGPGMSGKQKAAARVQQDRQRLSQGGGSN